MQAMLARVTQPDHLPRLSALHHARGLGRRPRLATAARGAARTPRGVDHRRHEFSQTGHPFGRRGASGTCGALGKIANCQVAVTAALWTGVRAWVTGALLYLPKPWLSDTDRRAVAHIPAGASFQEKWRQALTLIRRARAAGLQITAVLADAEFGDVTAFRRALHRWRLPYAVGISRHLTVFPGTPAVHVPPSGRMGRPRSQLVLVHDTRPIAVRALALALPARAWRRVTWRNGTNRPWAARFAAVRVTPANDWRDRRLAPEVWLLCEQDLGATPRTKYFFVDLPATRIAEAVGPTRASALGDRAAVSRAQDRTRLRSFRRALVSRVAASRRAHGRRVRLPPAGAAASRCRRVAHLSRHSSHRPGNFHGTAVCATTGLFQTHRRIAAN